MAVSSRILIVDDQLPVIAAFEHLLTSQGYQVTTARHGMAALAEIQRQPPDLVVMDIQMPGLNGLEIFQQIKRSHPKLPVVFMTGKGNMQTAIDATRLGAFDYQLKPFDPAEMIRIIERGLDSARLMRRSIELHPTGPGNPDVIVGDSPEMQEVFKAIGRVAETDATVLIRGESGTGKELVARAIYQYSLRKHASLHIVNCVAIPETLLESELFGHEQGAFTGATAQRIGKFEQANGGTIFLDEIGDVAPTVQAKILRVLQERTFQRVGGNATIRVDVRVIAATNHDLEKAIGQGTFREDLYHRLNVVTLYLPALRDRRADIPAITAHFLERYAEEAKVEIPALSEGAMRRIREHSWPGNVRELQNCIQRAMIFTRGHAIQESDIDRALAPPGNSLSTSSLDVKLIEVIDAYLLAHRGHCTHADFLERVDRLLVVQALARTSGNQSEAAKLIGIPRPTLHAKLQKYGIQRNGG
jgi:nitrogen regulation protein NR(I)